MFQLKNIPSEVCSPSAAISVKPVGSASETATEPKLKEISLKKLVDKLNYINFQDGTVHVNFTHIKYNQELTIPAHPQPCIGNSLNCIWSDRLDGFHKLNSLQFVNFSFSDGLKIYQVEPEALALNEAGVDFILPEKCIEITPTQSILHRCDCVDVKLIQHGAVFSGYLIGFNPSSLYIQVHAIPPQTFSWINRDCNVNVLLSNDTETLYTGECRIMDQKSDFSYGIYMLAPIVQSIQRFSPKEFRSPRQTLIPPPNLVFRHPLTQKMIDLKADNLSGTGFSVVEEMNNPVLLSGMVIPNLLLNFSDGFSISCRAQVIYCRILNDKKLLVRCGIAILDMGVQDHMKLLGILQQANNHHTYICSKVDMDELWHFFFETGFIYPGKYAFIKANKYKIKETYEKLYTQSPSIARHFIYQDKGQILGHLAMLRFYEDTWLIHHHAAKSSFANRAGIVVLNQIGRFVNDSHNLYSIHMKYLMCYYRPTNRFPHRVFGGAADAIKNRQGCSVDNFAYFHRFQSSESSMELPEPWTVTETRVEDLSELENYYEYESGGLSLEALDLVPERLNKSSLDQEYARLGYKRKRYLFSLFKQDDLKAVFLINVSDMGLNLSDLTNSISVFILESNDVPPELVTKAIDFLSRFCEQQEFSVLLYPVSYADKFSISYEKIYILWVLNMQFTDAYFRHLKHLLRSEPL